MDSCVREVIELRKTIMTMKTLSALDSVAIILTLCELANMDVMTLGANDILISNKTRSQVQALPPQKKREFLDSLVDFFRVMFLRDGKKENWKQLSLDFCVAARKTIADRSSAF